jgi:GH25 family lysozyme M1 (1,4-beta-N-acetylmuramidase)
VTLLPKARRRSLRTALTAAVTTAAAAVVAVVTPYAGTAQAAGLPTGPDVSRWQHGTAISWSAVKASGQSFVFVKATEGSGYTNAYFAADWAQSRAVGLYRGAYHFARPSSTSGSALAQARHFVKVAGTHRGAGDLPPVLDLESDGGLSAAALATWTQQWLTEATRLTGRTPIIYTYPSFWKVQMAGTAMFAEYPLWIADYSGTSAPTTLGIWKTWTFWQVNNTTTMPGISGNVDFNRFNGSASALARLANLGTTAPAPAPSPAPTQAPAPPVPAPAPIVPALATTVTAAATRAVSHGSTASVTGRLTQGTAALAGRTVDVLTRATGATTWTKVAQARTSTSGAFSAPVRPAAGVDVSVRFAGSPATGTAKALRASSSKVVTVSVRPKVSAKLAASVVRTNSRTTLTAAVSPAKAGQKAYRQRLVRGAWRTWQTASVGRDGVVRFAITTSGKATYRYRVLVPARTGYAAASSAAVTLTVR